MSRNPLLGEYRSEATSPPSRSNRSGGGNAREVKGNTLLLFSNVFRGGLIAPNSITYDSICLMLNAETETEQDELTRIWRDHKLEELNFVGTVGALLATTMCTTGSWPTILSNGREHPWYIRVCWLGGLVLALFSVLTAAQQSLRLHRLSAHRDGLQFIRRSLTYERESGGFRPAMIQIYAWQISMAFLTASVVVLLVGILLLVWRGAMWGPKKQPDDGWWDEGSRMAVGLTIVVVASTLVFILSQPALSERRESDVKWTDEP